MIDFGSPNIGLACLTGCLDTWCVINRAKTMDPDEFAYRSYQYDWGTFKGNCSKKGHKGKFRRSSTLFNHDESTVDAETLFDYICQWDEANYIMCAGTGGRPGVSGSHDNKKQGIADSHIYSVIAARKGVCGQFDLICFRNPWGRGEFEGGGWNDGGTMWDAYPEAYEELQYAADPDDGAWVVLTLLLLLAGVLRIMCERRSHAVQGPYHQPTYRRMLRYQQES